VTRFSLFSRGGHAGRGEKIRIPMWPEPAAALATAEPARTYHAGRPQDFKQAGPEMPTAPFTPAFDSTPPWEGDDGWEAGYYWSPGHGITADVMDLDGREPRGWSAWPQMWRILPRPAAETRPEPVITPPAFPKAAPFTADYRELPEFRATLRIAGWCGLSYRPAS
jgi:hypothetical protein